jgi:hypothetical protein
MKVNGARFWNMVVLKRGTTDTVQEIITKCTRCCLISCAFKQGGYLSQLSNLMSLSFILYECRNR